MDFSSMSPTDTSAVQAESEVYVDLAYMDQDWISSETVPTNATILNLKNSNLTSLPDINFEHLKVLDLSGNRIKAIDIDTTSQFVGLEVLDLSRNLLYSVDFAAGLPLQKLFLKNCQLPRAPMTVSQLKELRHLCLASNALQNFPPEVIGLNHLETLDLSDNRLAFIPKSLFGLTALKHLNLSENFGLVIDSGINDLQALETLNLDSTRTLEFKDNLCLSLPNLKRLNLKNTGLRSIPSCILSLSTLEEIDLRFNLLNEIKGLSSLYNLCRLNLRGNGLQSLQGIYSLPLEKLIASENTIAEIDPEIGRMTQLQVLNLETNELSEVPSELQNLTNLSYLNLARNNLTKFPEAILSLPRLNTLYFRNNAIPAVPDELAQLKDLRRLDLRNTGLTRIPYIPQVEVLDLGHNPLEAEALEVLEGFKNLRVLYLSKCSFQKVPPVLSRLSQLKELDLSNNQFDSIPALDQLVNLQFLGLNSCHISAIHYSVFNLPNLRLLRLTHNPIASVIPKTILSNYMGKGLLIQTDHCLMSVDI